eukprot:scaffold33069_cov107-Isochrysis_galbana.AAC.1
MAHSLAPTPSSRRGLTPTVPWPSPLVCTGPLDASFHQAGADRPAAAAIGLQRALTAQWEEAAALEVEEQYAALADTDPRREAWYAVDAFSAQWIA